MTDDAALLQGQQFCYWCERACWRKQLTRDHVVPRFAGGTMQTHNIVKACTSCQLERSWIVSASIHVRLLNDRIIARDPTRSRAVKRMRDKIREWHRIQDKWGLIERRRIGYSPSAAFDLNLLEDDP